MTEQQWLATSDPAAMLEAFDLYQHQRKTRLMLLAHCYRGWDYLNERGHAVVQIADRFLEGQATAAEMAEASQTASELFEDAGYFQNFISDGYDFQDEPVVEDGIAYTEVNERYEEELGNARLQIAVSYCLAALTFQDAQGDGWVNWRVTSHWYRSIPDEKPIDAHNIRCIFGYPGRKVSVEPSWLTPTVQTLARLAYQERIWPAGELDTARLLVLSDALEEAGCAHADVLEHLRSGGPHVRGCWVVDLLLHKA